MDSDLLHTEKILADRKTFFLDLKENSRGMVVKITEDVSGNRDTIMVPAEILGDFIAALTDIKATADDDLSKLRRTTQRGMQSCSCPAE